MIFSLGKLEEFFAGLTIKEIFRIYLDIRKIRKTYRKKYGFVKALELTVDKILDAFFFHCVISNLDMYGEDAVTNWNEFLKRCTECDGPYYLNLYL